MKYTRIILFDGICNFCNFWINFIIERDKCNVYKFAALQSEKGQEFLEKFQLDKNTFDTFFLIEGDRVFDKSTAALRISKYLKGLWKYFYLLIIIPKPVRDFLYYLLAKNRYKFFGKRDTCRVPNEEDEDKFLT